MDEPLLVRLSDRCRLIAPDYPGFGHSDLPGPNAFAYTFDPHRWGDEPLHRSDRGPRPQLHRACELATASTTDHERIESTPNRGDRYFLRQLQGKS
jgi:hypothetical protein